MQQALFDALPPRSRLPSSQPAQVQAHVRWWRLQGAARRAGRPVEPLLVTPRFLARIAVTHCPVTRAPLAGRDAQVLALHTQASVAAGHLVTVGPRAAAARPGSWTEAWARAEQLQAAAPGKACAPPCGLDADQWRRLAVLRSFVQPLTAAQAATLPLLVLPPNRVRVLSAVQGLQIALTLALAQPRPVPALCRLVDALPAEDTRQALRVLLLTVLARRPAGLDRLSAQARRVTLEDLWLDPLLQRRWQRLALRLDDAQAARCLALGRQLGLWGAGWRSLGSDEAVDGWDLPGGSGPGPGPGPGLECGHARTGRQDTVSETTLGAGLLGPAARGHGADAGAAPAAHH